MRNLRSREVTQLVRGELGLNQESDPERVFCPVLLPGGLLLTLVETLMVESGSQLLKAGCLCFHVKAY